MQQFESDQNASPDMHFAANDEEMRLYQHFENRHNKHINRITNIQSNQHISGCLFGCIGLILLGISSFIIHKGRYSQRDEEITGYVHDVGNWAKNGAMEKFAGLDI